jgi:hypothetical protein
MKGKDFAIIAAIIAGVMILNKNSGGLTGNLGGDLSTFWGSLLSNLQTAIQGAPGQPVGGQQQQQQAITQTADPATALPAGVPYMPTIAAPVTIVPNTPVNNWSYAPVTAPVVTQPLSYSQSLQSTGVIGQAAAPVYQMIGGNMTIV